MKVVGLTGVMGSGKSTVAGGLSKMGVPHYNCDLRAKELMVSELKDSLIAIVGDELFDSSGVMDRAYMASRIFSDSELRAEVEALVHGALRVDIKRWAEQNRDSRYGIVESAILYGSILEGDIDIVVAVVAPEGEIIHRVRSRDGISEEQVRARLACQLSQSELERRAQEVIYTANNEPVGPKIVALNEKLLTLCP